MRLAVISDIHGNLTALEAALADLESVGDVDMTWVLGDLAAFGPRPAACVQRVRELAEAHGKEKFKVIGGNTDRYLVHGERPKAPAAEDADALSTFKQQRATLDRVLDWSLEQLTWEDYEFLAKTIGRETSLKADGYGYVIGYHGVPGNDETNLKPDTSDEEARDALLDREGNMGIGGHIHVHMDRDLGHWRAVNVGSVGLSFDMPGMAQWGLFTFANGAAEVDLRAVPYDMEQALSQLNTSGHPAVEWAVNFFRQTS